MFISIILLLGVTACTSQTAKSNTNSTVLAFHSAENGNVKEISFAQSIKLPEEDISKIILSNVRTGTESEIIAPDEIKKTFDKLANQKMLDTTQNLPAEHPAGPIFEIDFYSKKDSGHINYLFNQGFRKEDGYSAEIGVSGCKASDFNSKLISLSDLFETHHVLFEGARNDNQLSDLREQLKKAKNS
jgi:hypothetical protein